MAQLRKRFDINFGGVKDITKSCGISIETALSIVKHRTSFGSFSTPEEVLRVPGLSKEEYRSISQMFKTLNRGRIPPITPKIPHPRNISRGTNDGFMLQGLSMNNNSNEVKYRQRSAPTRRTGLHNDLVNYPTALLRNGKRYKPGTEYFQIAPNRASTCLPPKNAANNCRFQGRYPPSNTSSKSGSGKNEASKSPAGKVGGLLNLKTGTVTTLVKKKQSKTDTDNNPAAITVRTTPCGNRINFSCTIDKEILQEPTSMSFMFDKRDQERKKLEKKSATESSTQHSSVGSISESTASSALSQQNVINFEKANTPSGSEKRERIEKWIRKVNSDRSIFTNGGSAIFRSAARSLVRSKDKIFSRNSPVQARIISKQERGDSTVRRLLQRSGDLVKECQSQLTVPKEDAKPRLSDEHKVDAVSPRRREQSSAETRKKIEAARKLAKTSSHESSCSSKQHEKEITKRAARHQSPTRVSSESVNRNYYRYHRKSTRRFNTPNSEDGCAIM